MIATDSSTFIAYLNGLHGRDVDLLHQAIASGTVALPPVVVAEVLTDPESARIETHVLSLPTLSLTDGYWERAGRSRRLLITKSFKARVADALIAQACIDADVPLITRDRDFRHFEKHCGLKLA